MVKTMDARGDTEDAAAEAKSQGYMQQLGTEGVKFQRRRRCGYTLRRSAPRCLDDFTGECT
jgi:hypothetical protein